MQSDDILGKLDMLSTLDALPQDAFYRVCVRERMNINLLVYYNRLQSTLDALYAKIRKRDFARYMERVNKELRKTKGTQFCYIKASEEDEGYNDN